MYKILLSGTPFFLGLLFLTGWHANSPLLLQLPPATWPIPYASALCILLSGMSLSSLFFSRLLLTKFFGSLILIAGGQNLLHQCYGVGYSFFSSMKVGAAIGFFLIGLLFLTWSRQKNTILKIVELLLSSALLFLGSIGMFFPLIRSGNGLELVMMHFYTSVCFFLIGIGFIFARYLPAQQE